MRQNNNQYNLTGRRKTMFLAAGILVILAALIIVVFLFRDRTNASTGNGDVSITGERMEQIADDVGDRVMDSLKKDVLADLVRETAAKELTKEKIYKILADSNADVVAIGDEELSVVIKKMLEDAGIAGDHVFTDEQEKYIRLTINRILAKNLETVDPLQPLTDTEKSRLTEQLRREMEEMIRNQIQNSSYKLTEQELSAIKRALNLDQMIAGKVDTLTRQQLQQLQETIVKQVEKQVKSPVKGVDYLTKAEIKAIQDGVLKQAADETLKQIQDLTKRISDIKSSVSTLTKQIHTLKELDQDKTADFGKMQKSIAEINTSIQKIHSVTEKLTGAVSVGGSHLERVSASGSDIRAEKVSVGNMTVAEFVDVLAGNDQVYTGAVRELNQIVQQLKEENKKQDTDFDQSLKQLEHSLDDNGKEMDDVRSELQKSDEELKKELEQQTKEQNEKLEQQTKEQEEKLDKQTKEQNDKLDEQTKEQDQKLKTEQKEREEADAKLQTAVDDINARIGDEEDAEKAEGETIFQKIGSIIRILSSEGIEGLRTVLAGIGGAQTLEEGVGHLHTDLTDARERVRTLEKEKWISNLTLRAEAGAEGSGGYTYEESGSAYVYRIPLVSDEDEIDLSADSTSVVINFKNPGRLASNAAFTTSGNELLITFTNRPTRDMKIVSIHVYEEK